MDDDLIRYAMEDGDRRIIARELERYKKMNEKWIKFLDTVNEVTDEKTCVIVVVGVIALAALFKLDEPTAVITGCIGLLGGIVNAGRKPNGGSK